MYIICIDKEIDRERNMNKTISLRFKFNIYLNIQMHFNIDHDIFINNFYFNNDHIYFKKSYKKNIYKREVFQNYFVMYFHYLINDMNH